ncbi:hypothetical protein AKL21_10240 [Enterococcus canintestini]|uniref:Uncharacterized protein n=1 Tax=Enterococcus canintestini TaxID=317010 RepID=A0A267HPR3_9ENTE|nr:hypothetical protein AKL21_10240 [Enterococcus canintestini]
MNRKLLRNKSFWICIILFDLGFLFYGFLMKSWFWSLLSLIIVMLVKYFSYDLLFKKFDDKWDKKHKIYLEKKRRYQKNV